MRVSKKQYYKVCKEVFGVRGGDVIIMSYDMVYNYYLRKVDKDEYPFSVTWLDDMERSGFITEV